MKSKDFIKLIQEEDPTGESHVRIDGGEPCYVELKEGYWDGPYQYRDGDEWVISTKGDKLDIMSRNWEDFIINHKGDYSKIRLDLTYCKDYTDEWLERFKKISEEYKEIIKKLG